MNSEETCEALRRAFPSAVHDQTRFRDETTLRIDAASLRDICLHLRDQLGFNYLIDITSIDHLGNEPRYEIAYEVYSMKNAVPLRLKLTVSEDDCAAPTVADIWPTADWHEREIYDMMGIRFINHPDLRRILMWEGCSFHPLRKDFPLQGRHSEVPNIAFSEPAPLAGGPFVTVPTNGTTQVREPRARQAGATSPSNPFFAEP
jgi:NADH-quinone oxidoreductase subunit C